MKKHALIKTALAALMAFLCASCAFSWGGHGNAQRHYSGGRANYHNGPNAAHAFIDENGDGKCDLYDTHHSEKCPDANGDGICDYYEQYHSSSAPAPHHNGGHW